MASLARLQLDNPNETPDLDRTFLRKLVVASAPEPEDIMWNRLNDRVFSKVRLFRLVICNAITLTLLVLFSTPAAVLNYLQLDQTSTLYQKLEDQDNSIILTLLATWLPSLLLILVNWLLFNTQFYLSGRHKI